MDDARERYFHQARKRRHVRPRSHVGTRNLVDEGQDVVTVPAIVDSGDPPWIGRGGKGDRGKQHQCHNDRKDSVDRSASRTPSSTRLHLVLRTRISVHLKPPIAGPDEKRENDRCVRGSVSRRMPAVSTRGPSELEDFVGPLALYAFGRTELLQSLAKVDNESSRAREWALWRLCSRASENVSESPRLDFSLCTTNSEASTQTDS